MKIIITGSNGFLDQKLKKFIENKNDEYKVFEYDILLHNDILNKDDLDIFSKRLNQML